MWMDDEPERRGKKKDEREKEFNKTLLFFSFFLVFFPRVNYVNDVSISYSNINQNTRQHTHTHGT